MDLDAFLPLLDPTADPRVLTRADAFARGYSRRAIDHRVATGRWRRVLPRTYLTVDTLTWRDRLDAALAFAGPQALLSGAAALADEELRSVRRPDQVLVVVPLSVAVHPHGWVRVRRTARMPERALLPGPRRVPMARAVADLALERRRLDDVRALVTEAVRRDLCTIEELMTELATGPRSGSAFLRQAIEEASGGAWSAPEARAATVLRRAGVPAFEPNARINLPDGRWFFVDFLWRELRAVLEIDSVEHHASPPDADNTSDKHLALETLGYSVVHRMPRFVTRQPRAFVTGIAAWLDARRAALSA